MQVRNGGPPASCPRHHAPLGPGETLTRKLEGPYDKAAGVLSYGAYATDSPAGQDTLLETGGVAPGGIIDVPIKERGDAGSVASGERGVVLLAARAVRRSDPRRFPRDRA